MNSLRVFEHEALYTSADSRGRCLTQQQYEQLCAYNDRHGSQYFTVLRRGIKFSHFVGVIQVGRTTIEILPKTDNREETAWRNVLLQMLSLCGKVPRKVVADATLRKRNASLMELYLHQYLDEVESLAHRGLIKKYGRRQGQTKALKGKLLMAPHLRKNVIHKERFYTEHTVYSADNLYNQVLKKGLEVIKSLPCAPQIKDRAAGLSLYFQSVSTCGTVTEETFTRLRPTRHTEAYREALAIARLLILNYAPDIKTGTENLLAILFNMNDLWEQYIFRMLHRTRPTGVMVHAQSSKHFWKAEGLQVKTIRPDIVIEKDGCTWVIDTKWKRLTFAKPSDNDLKQMYAYNLHWNCRHSILLYPQTPQSPPATYGRYLAHQDVAHGCSLAFISLPDGNGGLEKEVLQNFWRWLDAK
ncbi:McrC family protein [Roseivirga sp. BDSF3-8]|uniref:McrC family protein n=1 Tax=Roseivirga sp. BDSF3-8 TaxID=3241598 RepID=UPI003532796E